MAKFRLSDTSQEGVMTYTGEPVSGDETFELDDDRLAEKARNNPAFEEVKRGPRKKADDS